MSSSLRQLLVLELHSPYILVRIYTYKSACDCCWTKGAVIADVPPVCNWHQHHLQPVWQQKNQVWPQEIGVGVSGVRPCHQLVIVPSWAASCSLKIEWVRIWEDLYSSLVSDTQKAVLVTLWSRSSWIVDVYFYTHWHRKSTFSSSAQPQGSSVTLGSCCPLVVGVTPCRSPQPVRHGCVTPCQSPQPVRHGCFTPCRSPQPVSHGCVTGVMLRLSP